MVSFRSHFGSNRLGLSGRSFFSVSPLTDGAMAVPLQFVDTSDLDLKVYAALHVSELPDILLSRVITPAHVMLETGSRSWVPLCCDKEEAVTRGRWGYEEMRKCACSASEIVVVEINFTAYGATYYLMNNTLTTREGSRYRYYGNIPFRSVSLDGQILVQVGGIDVLQVGGISGVSIASMD
jgi:hypothetical protein